MIRQAALVFPDIDPIAISLGPFQVRWYALAYVVGLLFAFAYMKRLVRSPALWNGKPPTMTPEQVDDFFLWATLGVIIASWAFARALRIRLDQLLDLAAAAVPVGLGLGRLANFINGELFGRISDVPWAMLFPYGGPLPRHPSQLYEAFLEGICLFLLCRIATHRFLALRHPGRVAGLFALAYGFIRIFVEFFREPDPQIGLYAGIITRGMVLSTPMLAIGLWLVIRSRRTGPKQRHRSSANSRA